jgi:hypothetical protein
MNEGLLAYLRTVLEHPKTIYRTDATCRWCGAEYALDAHTEDCEWDNAHSALFVLSRPTRFDG